MRITSTFLAIALLVTAACGGKGDSPPAQAGDTTGDTMTGGMQMSMQGMQMIPAMRAHLDSLATMTPAQMSSAMAAHQDLASRMMDAMGADMRGMNMTPDSAWTALGDSLRRDLAVLSGLSGEALTARMQGHSDRMRRMLGMHEQMMKM